MRGMEVYKSKDSQYDQFTIVIAGDAWLITGDDKTTAEWEYIGEFIRSLMYEATQINPREVPASVVETAKLIALEYYAADWQNFNTREG